MLLKSMNVSKKYLHKMAVNQVSLELEEGRIYALLGQNGSGKTTLMKMFAGLVKPDQGEILFSGEKIGVKSKQSVAYMPTEAYFYDYMKVADVGDYYFDFFKDFNRIRFDELLNKMELDKKDKVKYLSSGQLVKLKLSVTLARNAKLYLLDEPLNRIDLLTRDVIVGAIVETCSEDNIIVISSHLVDELEKVVDHVIFLERGKLKLLGDAEMIREENRKSIADVYREIMA